MTGIVTEHLTRTLADDIRSKGLLVWLDKDGAYSDFVDRLVENRTDAAFPYPVFAFRGSFVRLMRESYPVLAGANLPHCVIHLPGFSEDSIKSTPLYESYKAGCRWRVALETLVREAGQGHLTPQQLATLATRPDLTLQMADQALAEQIEVAPELRPLLTRWGEDGLVVALLTDSQKFASSFGGDEATLVGALRQRLERQIGMGAQWLTDWDERAGSIGALADGIWAFLLCREYATDMTREPASDRLRRLRTLSKEYQRSGARLLDALRREHPEAYVTHANQVAGLLFEAETAITPAMLGRIDTFRFEADVFLSEAFRLLEAGQWTTAAELAAIRLRGERTGTHTFWVSRDRQLARAWEWIALAADLGTELLAATNAGGRAADLAAVADEYQNGTWRIDQFHRRFMIQSTNLSSNGLDSYMASFSRVRATLMNNYRQWIDQTTRAWNAVCEAHGFLPARDLQQRSFYRLHIAPALRDGLKTAVILADALRYELGRDLETLIQTERLGETQLSLLLAELPTITAVGMNAIAPTVDGEELVPLFSADSTKIVGFRGGSRDVTTPTARLKTFADVSGVDCEWHDLNAFLGLNDKAAARLAATQLVIMASSTVDNEGEGDALRAGIDYFNSALTSIVRAVRRLSKIGFQRIVITADHGFILGDDTVKTAVAARLPGVDRRHALGDPRSGEDLVAVRLPQLQYRADQAVPAIVFHRASHLLSSRPAGSFYHGGNSAQERIVPVIAITAGTNAGREPGKYRLSYEVLPDALGTHRIKVTATETGSLTLFEKEPLEVRIGATDNVAVALADVIGGKCTGDLLTLTADTPCEFYFRLHGTASRARLRFESARPANTIENVESPEYFDVEPVSTAGPTPGATPIPAAPDAAAPPQPVAATDANTKASPSPWQEFVEPEFHTAIHHLQTHGALLVRFLEKSLGGGSVGARRARQFARKLDQWQPYLPFRVTIYETAEGKEYRTS